MSYLEILAYISVGLISFSWILVLIIDTGKKIVSKKTNKPPSNENQGDQTNG